MSQGIQVFDLGQGIVKVSLAAPDCCQHDLARHRQLHASGQPVEQRLTHLRFEIEDLLVDRCCGQVQRRRGLAHRTSARHLVKASKSLRNCWHVLSVKFFLTPLKKQTAIPDADELLEWQPSIPLVTERTPWLPPLTRSPNADAAQVLSLMTAL
jgi:hypothetical protein